MNLHEFNKKYVHKRCRIYPGFYTKTIADVIDPTKAVLVFGDNTNRQGTGGQAIIRYSDSVLGISTKRRSGVYDSDYFSDYSDSDKSWIVSDINRLHEMMLQNQNLIAYFPEHGLGTGLSEMPTRCPKLFKEMNDIIYERFGIDYRIEE